MIMMMMIIMIMIMIIIFLSSSYMYIIFLIDTSLDKLLTNYEVLVSSPGISNILTIDRDFETFKVRTVLTELN